MASNSSFDGAIRVGSNPTPCRTSLVSQNVLQSEKSFFLYPVIEWSKPKRGPQP